MAASFSPYFLTSKMMQREFVEEEMHFEARSQIENGGRPIVKSLSNAKANSARREKDDEVLTRF